MIYDVAELGRLKGQLKSVIALLGTMDGDDAPGTHDMGDSHLEKRARTFYEKWTNGRLDLIDLFATLSAGLKDFEESMNAVDEGLGLEFGRLYKEAYRQGRYDDGGTTRP